MNETTGSRKGNTERMRRNNPREDNNLLPACTFTLDLTLRDIKCQLSVKRLRIISIFLKALLISAAIHASAIGE